MMDAQSLFSHSGPQQDLNVKKTIAVGNDIDDRPLIYGLENEEGLQLKHGYSRQRFEWISQGVVDMAFISSIDFSLLKGGWKVLPRICKSTKGPSKRTALFFNKNLNDITSIAIPENARTSEIVLKLILKELHQIETKFVKFSSPLPEALKKCDAALLTGDQAVFEIEKNPFYIDLGEEWYDLTGLPLVYGFWIGNELTTQKDDYKNLSDSYDLGKKNIPLIAKKCPQNSGYISEYLTSVVNYRLTEEEQAGLDELYRFSFFYGLSEYIPEFNFAEI